MRSASAALPGLKASGIPSNARKNEATGPARVRSRAGRKTSAIMESLTTTRRGGAPRIRRIALGTSNREQQPGTSRAQSEVHRPLARVHCDGKRLSPHGYIAGTVFQGSKLPLTVWFLAIDLVSQAKTGLSALALKRHPGVSYPTAWLIQHKLMRAMEEREARHVLGGQVQVNDAYLAGERPDGKTGRGPENKVPFLAAISPSEEGHPLRAKLTLVPGFTLKAIAQWAKSQLAPGSTVLSDGLACFNAVTDA